MKTQKKPAASPHKKRYKLHPYPTTPMKELFAAVALIRNEKEAVEFFRDLLTISELEEFANRWQMVKLLVGGKPYLEIAEKLGTSTTTVARVAKWLYSGTGGYEAIAKRAFGKNPDRHERPTLHGKSHGLLNPRSM